MKFSKGYTLVELMVWILIIGIISAIAIPSVGIIRDASLKVDARNLLSDIRYIKQQTLLTGIQHKIVFSKEGYDIFDDTQNTIRTYKFKHGNILENYQLNRGPSKVNYMSYTIDGNACASGTLIISNRDKDKKLKISIVPVTGRTLLSNK